MTASHRTPTRALPPLLLLALVVLGACDDGRSEGDAPPERPVILFVDAAGETSRMMRLDPGSEAAEVVRPELADGARGLALDRSEGILYWASRDGDRIQFGRWTDASVSDLRLTGLDSAYAVDFVEEENALYWSDYGTDAIHRLDLGTGTPSVLVDGLVAPRQIALDREGGWIYWVDRGAGTVQRVAWPPAAAAGGTNPAEDGTPRAPAEPETLITGMSAPYGIALDSTTGTLLVADAEVGAIYRLDPDPAPDPGTGETAPTLEDWLPEAGTHPSFLAVDEAEGMLYWGDNRDNVLRRRPLDGGEVEVIAEGLAGPRGLVLIR